MVPSDEKDRDTYRRIKVAGIISLIPIVLPLGPLAGYMGGAYLEAWFHTTLPLAKAFALIGIIASGREVYRLIRAALKYANDEVGRG